MKVNFYSNTLIKLLTIHQLVFIFYHVAQGQSTLEFNEVKSIVDTDIVYTPFGPTNKSNVHFVNNDSHISILKNSIQVVHNKSNTVHQEYYNIKGQEQLLKNKLNIYKDATLHSANKLIDKNDGWITHAECYSSISDSGPFEYFSSTFVVPSPPLRKSEQLIYLFIGLGTIEYGVSHIVQPVLQWGKSPAGGGDYWAICNWYVLSNYTFFYDTLIKVESGFQLKGIIKLLSNQDTIYSYSSSFEVLAKKSELVVEGLPLLIRPYVALEAYEINECEEYPIDEKIRFSNIQLSARNVNPPVLWQTVDRINGCRQFSKIINPSSNNGEVEIHFHSPTDIDNFSDIHIYPNPVNDYLHISPNTPIQNLIIEIYDFTGKLRKSEFYEYVDYEFNLDTKALLSGIYLVKFKYLNPNTQKTNTYIYKMIKSSV